MQSRYLKNLGLMLGGVGLVSLLSNCNQTTKPGNNPIVADRGVEYLDFTEGEIPQWKKKGEINLPSAASTSKVED